MNNTTIFYSDRNPHIKVVALALIASIVVSLVAIKGHVAPSKASGLYSGRAHPISQTGTRT
jgi:hypothetical protein